MRGFVGTPYFASPEQLDGVPQHSGQGADGEKARKRISSDNHMAWGRLSRYPSRCGRRCSSRDPPVSLTELPAPKKVGELK